MVYVLAGSARAGAALMHLSVNGEGVELDVADVAGLVRHFGFDFGQVVVEVNGAVFESDSQHALESGDTVEIVRFIGGG